MVLDNFYVVDMFVPKQKLIIEVHGPIHYTFNRNLTMKSIVKRNLLEKIGYSYNAIDAIKVLKYRNLFRNDPDKILKLIQNQIRGMRWNLLKKNIISTHKVLWDFKSSEEVSKSQTKAHKGKKHLASN